MAARHTLWKWAGIVDDAWGRIKVLAGAFSVITTILLLLWLFVVQNLDTTGIIVLAFAGLFGLLALGLLASRLLPSGAEADGSAALATGALEPQEATAGFIDSLARRMRLMEMDSDFYAATDEEHFERLSEAIERVKEDSRRIYEALRDRCGYDVAGLYESDRGLDARYDGPAYPKTQDDLKRFVTRRQLRLDGIISDIRSGKIAVAAPRPDPRPEPEQAEVTPSPDAPDPAQLRRAINGARAKLTRQRDLLIQRRYDRLDPDDRGEWETEDRKGIMHQDARFRPAFLAVEEAFDAISLMDDPTEERRNNALAKIEVALRELDAAWEIAEGRAAPDRRQSWTPPPYEPPPEAFEAFALLEQLLGLRGLLAEWEEDERAQTLFPHGPTYKRLHRLLELAEDVVHRAPKERIALPDYTTGISDYKRAVRALREAIRELREIAAMKDPPGRFARIGELNESAETLLSVMADARRGVPTHGGLDGHRDRLVRWATYMDDALRQAGADEVQLAYFNQETELTLHGPSGDENEQIGQFMDDLKVRRARAQEIVAELRGRDE